MARKFNKEIVYKEQVIGLLTLLLEIASNDTKYSKDFEEDYRKRLKFQKQTDWKRFKASIDLLDDTEYAIMSAFQYQLGDVSKKTKDIGEMNLRLYGILNAVYLQMEAFKQIGNLLNYPSTRALDATFQQLDIYKLRGIAGAHTVNFMFDDQTLKNNPEVKKYTSFRIIQFYLEKTGSKIIVLDEHDIMFEFNLINILTEYEKIATSSLVKLIQHAIETVVHMREYKVEMRERLDQLLTNLINYSELDKNKQYKIRQMKRLKNLKSIFHELPSNI